MIQPVAMKDPITERFVHRVTATVDPWRIVLFGSRARGDWAPHSDYDFYVEVDVERERLSAVYHDISAGLSGFGHSYDLKLNCRGTIDRRRDDPGTLEWDVARQGILLYAHQSAPITLLPTVRTVREPSTPESMHEWLESGDHNRRHCDLLRSTAPGDFSPDVCWLSHQVVEKYLKAILVSRLVRPDRTHNLVDLFVTAREHEIALSGIDEDCELLKKYASEPRYPKGLDLGPDEAEAAYAAMTRVVDEVRKHLPPRVH